MLSPSDAAVVSRDLALPGLALLLDGAAVSSLLHAPVRRDYLRYKPGTSCVLGGRIEGPDGPADVFVAAYDADGVGKVDKTVAEAPHGTVLHVDRARGVVAALAAADRDLPLLAELTSRRSRRRALAALLPDRPDLSTARVQTLSYKPMRRWVGLLTPSAGPPVVLRAYRVADALRAVAVVTELARGLPRAPRLLGTDPSLGSLALEYVDGQSLDVLLARGAVTDAELFEVGRVLAGLHARRLDGLPTRARDDDTAAVRAAAAQIAVLLPELGGRAQQLADDLALRWTRLPVDATTVHGDFSADQVVVGGDGVTLLDWDRAEVGDAAADLGSLLAATSVTDAGGGPRRDVLPQVSAGYAGLRALPAQEAVHTHAAALLLRRAAEPFRRGQADWSARVRDLVDQAVAMLPGPLECAVDDLVAPLLGGQPTWQVLKDKPGRRRTSRATGPEGTAIVKVYASARAPVVARRVTALQHGPLEPQLPRVLLCDEPRHVVVLTEVPGRAFREAVIEGDADAAARVGRALATWHVAHRGRPRQGLRAHTAAREIEVLHERLALAPAHVRDVVQAALPISQSEWPADTVVHRDLYEDQIVLGERVGLLDLDDAAHGPAELDLGNLMAHLDLLERRTGVDVASSRTALLSSYEASAPVDRDLLQRCWLLSRLRLACVHRDPSLVPDPSHERTLIGGSPAAHAGGAG